ncbi:MAG: hypothetical protein RR602_10685 [Longicatena sp.]
MNKKKIYHQIALFLAFISIVITLALMICKEVGIYFIPVFTVSIAVLFEKISKNCK